MVAIVNLLLRVPVQDFLKIGQYCSYNKSLVAYLFLDHRVVISNTFLCFIFQRNILKCKDKQRDNLNDWKDSNNKKQQWNVEISNGTEITALANHVQYIHVGP